MKLKITMKKLIAVVVIFAILAFGIYNLLWFLNFNSYSKLLTNEYEQSEVSSLHYTKLTSDFVFSVKKPEYLSFVGNTSVANKDGSIVLIVWPSFLCEEVKDYGIILESESKNNFYMMYVNSKMEYMTAKNAVMPIEMQEKAKSLLTEYYTDGLAFIEIANTEFNI